jgi:uncharacterized protein (DUF885 family)
MKRIVSVIVLFLCMGAAAAAMTAAQFYSHTDSVIDRMARFDPVWATNLGIHNYDSLLADYSKANIEAHIKYFRNELEFLSKIDTAGWTIDQSIDYRLLVASVKSQLFPLEKYPYWKRAPSVYSDQCINGIYYLALRDFSPLDAKLPSLLGRLRRIPGACRTGKANLTEPVAIFVATSMESVDEGVKLIEDVCRTFSDSFPAQSAQITAARDSAVAALREFNVHILGLKAGAKTSPAIGKDNLNFVLSEIHLLDIDSDSLLSLGQNIYAWADSQMKALILPPKDTTARFPLACLSRHDMLEYYQWEINKVRDWAVDKGLVTLPTDFGQCEPMETPPFLRGTIRGIAYEPPGAFDSIQAGFFYVRPMPDTFTAEQKASNLDYIHKRGFRGSVVHEAYPGHHMQLLLANRVKSRVRKIQQNLILVEGWALYCEEMAFREGLFGEDLRQWNGVLGGIRFRAVRIIVDIGIHTGTMTPDSAMQFMNAKLGDNPFYYTAEIRRYCLYPASALSYLTGKTMIMALREQAQRQDGDSFRLGAFHDRLLSQGNIPPALIAEKYGWRKSPKTRP